jgi:hypothetical protein
LGEALDETFGVSGGRLVGDRVDDAEHVLGAMIAHDAGAVRKLVYW